MSKIGKLIRWQKYVQKKHRLGNGLRVVDMQTMFPKSNSIVPTFAFLDGGCLPTDIALLMNFAESIDQCNYFEIGTWRGESVVNVAENALHCTTLNISDEDMRRIGMSEEYIKLTGFFSKNKNNITHIRGNSLNFDFASLNQKFDLIFIDGDHHYEMVKNDTEMVFNNLIHENTIIVWHDYARNPETARFEVFAGILDGMPPACHKNLYHAGNTLSAFYTNKLFPTHQLQNPTQPRHFYSVKLESKKVI